MWLKTSPRWMINRFTGKYFADMVKSLGRDARPLIHHPDCSYWDAVGRFDGIRDGTVKYRPDNIGAWDDQETRVNADRSSKVTLKGSVVKKATSETGPRSSRSMAPARSRRASRGRERSRERRAGSNPRD